MNEEKKQNNNGVIIFGVLSVILLISLIYLYRKNSNLSTINSTLIALNEDAVKASKEALEAHEKAILTQKESCLADIKSSIDLTMAQEKNICADEQKKAIDNAIKSQEEAIIANQNSVVNTKIAAVKSIAAAEKSAAVAKAIEDEIKKCGINSKIAEKLAVDAALAAEKQISTALLASEIAKAKKNAEDDALIIKNQELLEQKSRLNLECQQKVNDAINSVKLPYYNLQSGTNFGLNLIPGEYTCPDAKNVVLDTNEYKSVCIFNTETDVRNWCKTDNKCIGYLDFIPNNGNIKYLALNKLPINEAAAINRTDIQKLPFSRFYLKQNTLPSSQSINISPIPFAQSTPVQSIPVQSTPVQSTPISYNLQSGSNFWDSNRDNEYTCPNAINVNRYGGYGGYANYCVFNTEADVQRWCSSDPNCKGYVFRGDIYQALNKPAVASSNISNSKYYLKTT